MYKRQEYKAFELCGPGKVLVASSIGPWESIGGDIKFLRLFQKKAAGIVTDGSVRDSKALEKYNFPVFAHSFTSKQGPGIMLPISVNDNINCGGILVRPGDYILGDDDGVVVFPKILANEIITITEEREEIEMMVKNELTKNPESPGKYYPFNDDTYKLYEELKKTKNKKIILQLENKMSTEGTAFHKGEKILLKDASVGIMTHAMHYGTAVFEGIRG